jgi:hypothetical protein
MRFTDSEFEKMMKLKPRPSQHFLCKPPPGSPCEKCSFWKGLPCVGTCYKELLASSPKKTSGHVGPKGNHSQSKGKGDSNTL